MWTTFILIPTIAIVMLSERARVPSPNKHTHMFAGNKVVVYTNSSMGCMNIYPRSAANLVSTVEECTFTLQVNGNDVLQDLLWTNIAFN